MSEDLTCPDYKLGHISVRSQDLANRNQDDTYIMCFAARHWKFTQTSREKRSNSPTACPQASFSIVVSNVSLQLRAAFYYTCNVSSLISHAIIEY